MFRLDFFATVLWIPFLFPRVCLCFTMRAQESLTPSVAPLASHASLMHSPTKVPSFQPSVEIVLKRTKVPTPHPTSTPSFAPSASPSNYPSRHPSIHPSRAPSFAPSYEPTTIPSKIPSKIPSVRPSVFPSNQPTTIPSNIPSSLPTDKPSFFPTMIPSKIPSFFPTNIPSNFPSLIPSGIPSFSPTMIPSKVPSLVPSVMPSVLPSNEPTKIPSKSPSAMPSIVLSRKPSRIPSNIPSPNPSIIPSMFPSHKPSGDPSRILTPIPSVISSSFQSNMPTSLLYYQPSIVYSARPMLVPLVTFELLIPVNNIDPPLLNEVESSLSQDLIDLTNSFISDDDSSTQVTDLDMIAINSTALIFIFTTDDSFLMNNTVEVVEYAILTNIDEIESLFEDYGFFDVDMLPVLNPSGMPSIIQTSQPQTFELFIPVNNIDPSLLNEVESNLSQDLIDLTNSFISDDDSLTQVTDLDMIAINSTALIFIFTTDGSSLVNNTVEVVEYAILTNIDEIESLFENYGFFDVDMLPVLNPSGMPSIIQTRQPQTLELFIPVNSIDSSLLNEVESSLSQDLIDLTNSFISGDDSLTQVTDLDVVVINTTTLLFIFTTDDSSLVNNTADIVEYAILTNIDEIESLFENYGFFDVDMLPVLNPSGTRSFMPTVISQSDVREVGVLAGTAAAAAAAAAAASSSSAAAASSSPSAPMEGPTKVSSDIRRANQQGEIRWGNQNSEVGDRLTKMNNMKMIKKHGTVTKERSNKSSTKTARIRPRIFLAAQKFIHLKHISREIKFFRRSVNLVMFISKINRTKERSGNKPEEKTFNEKNNGSSAMSRNSCCRDSYGVIG